MLQWLIIIMEGSKNLFCCSEFPRAGKRISSKFIDSLGRGPQFGSPALCPDGQAVHWVADSPSLPFLAHRWIVTVCAQCVCPALPLHPEPSSVLLSSRISCWYTAARLSQICRKWKYYFCLLHVGSLIVLFLDNYHGKRRLISAPLFKLVQLNCDITCTFVWAWKLVFEVKRKPNAGKVSLKLEEAKCREGVSEVRGSQMQGWCVWS